MRRQSSHAGSLALARFLSSAAVTAVLAAGLGGCQTMSDITGSLTSSSPKAQAVAEDPQRAAEVYGVIRAQLRRSGTPIGGNDMMIASIALASNLPVATRNQGEFRRIPGLRVEDW